MSVNTTDRHQDCDTHVGKAYIQMDIMTVTHMLVNHTYKDKQPSVSYKIAPKKSEQWFSKTRAIFSFFEARDRQTERQTDSHTDKQMEKQGDRQTDRQTDRERHH